MRRSALWEWIRDLILMLALALAFRAGVAEARQIPTPSMVPTILPGDRVLVDKLFFRFDELERGDIVVFRPPGGGKLDYIKRVIALPGEEVAVRDGRVWINGQPLEEPYIAEPPAYEYGPVRVPEGKVLVLGDNRNNSQDGHIWGLLDIKAIKGRAVFRFWPLSRWGPLK
ncbi:MAG: signal peptidase I [Bacillota bacterium]